MKSYQSMWHYDLARPTARFGSRPPARPITAPIVRVLSFFIKIAGAGLKSELAEKILAEKAQPNRYQPNGPGSGIQGSWSGIQSPVVWDRGPRVQGPSLRSGVWGPGSKGRGLGSGVRALGTRVRGPRSEYQGLGSGIRGPGSGVPLIF